MVDGPDGTYKSKPTDMYANWVRSISGLIRKLLLLMVRSHMKDPVHKTSRASSDSAVSSSAEKVDVVSQVAAPMERNCPFRCVIHGV